MYLSRKPVVKSWAKRAAFHAVDHLKNAWGKQLAWALDNLSSPAGVQTRQPILSDEITRIDPRLSPSPTPSVLSMAEELGVEPAFYEHRTFVQDAAHQSSRPKKSPHTLSGWNAFHTCNAPSTL